MNVVVQFKDGSAYATASVETVKSEAQGIRITDTLGHGEFFMGSRIEKVQVTL